MNVSTTSFNSRPSIMDCDDQEHHACYHNKVMTDYVFTASDMPTQPLATMNKYGPGYKLVDYSSQLIASFGRPQDHQDSATRFQCVAPLTTSPEKALTEPATATGTTEQEWHSVSTKTSNTAPAAAGSYYHRAAGSISSTTTKDHSSKLGSIDFYRLRLQGMDKVPAKRIDYDESEAAILQVAFKLDTSPKKPIRSSSTRQLADDVTTAATATATATAIPPSPSNSIPSLELRRSAFRQRALLRRSVTTNQTSKGSAGARSLARASRINIANMKKSLVFPKGVSVRKLRTELETEAKTGSPPVPSDHQSAEVAETSTTSIATPTPSATKKPAFPSSTPPTAMVPTEMRRFAPSQA